MQNSKISSKYPGCLYNPVEGSFFRLSKDNSVDRRLLPDELGNISYFCAFKKRPVKKKASSLGWEIMHTKDVPKDYLVYFKDLDQNNYKANNLCLISKVNYRSLQDAIENLDGAVKIQNHPSDAFVYYVKFREAGRVSQILCHDISLALRLKRRILIRSSKIVSKFVISE